MLKRYDTASASWVDADSVKRFDTATNSWVDAESVKAYDTPTQSWIEKWYKNFTKQSEKLKDTSSYTLLDNGVEASLYASMSDNEDFVTFSIMGLNLSSPTVKFNFDVVYGAPRVIFTVYSGPSSQLASVNLEGISGDRAFDQTYAGNTIYGFSFTFCTSLGEGFYEHSSHKCSITDFSASGIKFKFKD